MADVQKTIEYVVKTTDSASLNFQKIGLAAGAMGAAITAALAIAVNESRKGAREQAQLGAVLRSTEGAAGMTADAINELAERYSQLTSFSDGAIVSAANVMLTYTGISKDVFPRAQAAVLDMAAAMDMDLNQAAERVSNALQYPSLALASLTKQGFRFTDQQKAQIIAMEAAGNLAGAQAIILEELELAYKGTAEAIRDPLIAVQNEIQKLTAQIGDNLRPELERVAEQVIRFLGVVSQWMQDNPELVRSLTLITGALGLMGMAVGALTTSLIAVKFALAAIGVTLAVGGAFMLALGGVVTAIVLITQHWEGLKFVFNRNVVYMVGLAQEWMDGFLALISGAWGAIMQTWDEGVLHLHEQWLTFVDAIQTAVMAPIDFIRNAFNDLFSWLTAQIGGFITKVVDLASKVKSIVSGSSNRTTTKRSSGGTMTEPLTLVGEHGPELISAPGYKVHTAQETRGMGGGVNINVNVNGSLIGLGKRELAQLVGAEVISQLRPVLAF